MNYLHTCTLYQTVLYKLYKNNIIMEDHVKYLEDHCRVCGEKLQKTNSRTTSFSCIDHKADLQTAFDIDVTHDNKQENSPHFCNSAYA